MPSRKLYICKYFVGTCVHILFTFVLAVLMLLFVYLFVPFFILMLLPYFCLFIDHVTKFIIFVFITLVYHAYVKRYHHFHFHNNIAKPVSIGLLCWYCHAVALEEDIPVSLAFHERINEYVIWRICKQTKLSHLGHREPSRIH